MDMNMDSMQRISPPKAEGDYNVIRIGAGGGISLCESSAKKSTCYAHDISADEEDLINRLHKLLGDRWSLIAGRLPWRRVEEIQNYCDSSVEYDKKNSCSAHDISADEEELINRLHKLLGDRWALIAGRLPWRKVEEIENYCKMRYTPSTSSSHS